ncbi:hypothetical protein RBH26_08750 [Natronolimnohabitans sp. A-GB9]|uniref:hypothetical protein n=1 Tax=Natronolimnohabitans sp. A-GB9 TaxID=3069757 RepID=UPI0027B64C0C|nr:hypothetical protein [Natronolimnohabitans sp. A-GB9]MDQ2050575.1 hypothetical protein [Natronolimnohabitans sp. A-GB9]
MADGPRTRRSLLLSAGAAGSVSIVGHVRASAEDSDGDGIPDRTKRSAAFHRRLESIFGAEQFSGLEVGRRDLLLDVRYVGETQLVPSTKRTIVEQCRARGIHAQWLDYPRRYDLEEVTERYGTAVKDLLWGRRSFYAGEIESDLKNVALQLVVVPGVSKPGVEGRIYSHWMDTTGSGIDGYVNGFSVGNRAVVAERDDPLEEARLVFHEIAHLALCHDDDPENTGVMGTGDDVDLTDEEWERFRDGLSNVRDRTGYDVLFRPCLWHENLSAVLE